MGRMRISSASRRPSSRRGRWIWNCRGTIIQEAAIYADKVAVDEETVRLRSHVDQLQNMLSEGGVIGRKLDFLMQEMNREANTIGSKGNDVEQARNVVNIKSELEKIREQIQNIE